MKKILTALLLCLTSLLATTQTDYYWMEQINSNMGRLYPHVLRKIGDGEFMVIGTYTDDITDEDYPFLIKLDRNGNILWQKKINNMGLELYDLYPLNSNSYIVVGKTDRRLFRGKIHFDGTNLVFDWQRDLDADGTQTTIKKSTKSRIVKLHDGHFAVIGTAGRKIFYHSFSENEAPFVSRIIGDNDIQYGRAIFPTSDGSLIVGTSRVPGSNTTKIYIAKLNTFGEIEKQNIIYTQI
jgi:hypothetical protein